MEFVKHHYPPLRTHVEETEYLSINANIKFDNEVVFCGKPRIILEAMYDKPFFSWNEYEIGVGIRDDDDFDIGHVYKPTKEQFFDVLHELINWIHDLEMGCCCWDEFIKDPNFFPNLDCEREKW